MNKICRSGTFLAYKPESAIVDGCHRYRFERRLDGPVLVSPFGEENYRTGSSFVTINSNGSIKIRPRSKNFFTPVPVDLL